MLPFSAMAYYAFMASTAPFEVNSSDSQSNEYRCAFSPYVPMMRSMLAGLVGFPHPPAVRKVMIVPVNNAFFMFRLFAFCKYSEHCCKDSGYCWHEVHILTIADIIAMIVDFVGMIADFVATKYGF